MCPDQLPLNDRLNDPLMTALLISYANHQRFFYVNYFKNFKLIAEWLLEEPVSDRILRTNNNNHIPWFAGSYELQELAIILNVSQGDLYLKLMELQNGNRFSR